MPSARWLFFAVIAIYSTQWIESVIAADLSDHLPVASNGWRPIIGTRVKPYAIEEHHEKELIENTNGKHTAFTTNNRNESDLSKNKNEKENSHKNPNQNGKPNTPVHISHHGSTGHHPKLHPPPPNKPYYKTTGPGNNMHMMVTGKPVHRHPVMNKLHAHMALSAKRHKPGKPTNAPSRHKNPNHGLRDEILAPAPSSAIGSYAYFNQGPLSIQNTQLGNKPYHTPGHVDFSNRFAFNNANNDLLLQHQHFNFPKHPSQNELQPNQFVFINHNDEFTRNLVPPPPVYKPQGEKETLNPKIPDQSASVNQPHLTIGKHKENIIVQIPGSYNFQHPNIGKPEYDLEITKENFQEYHTTLAPSSFKTSTESYIDGTRFTKHKPSKTSQSGYEVTEEKDWIENLPSYKPVFSTPNGAVGLQQYKNQFSTAVPDTSKFHYSQQHLNIPLEVIEDNHGGQFLPTPYNQDSVFPTLPTQPDISTVYAEVSQINKKKRPFSTVPPKYNLKDVATHFPIFEEKQPVPAYPSSNKENFQNKQNIHEIPNETTSQKTTTFEDHETTMPFVRPTQQTIYSTRGTTQRKPNHRRRRPTRPTSTTTEAPANIENVFDAYRTQNSEGERNVDTTYRRRRPIKYRTTEAPQTEVASNIEATTRSTISYRPKPTRHQPQTTEEVHIVRNNRRRPTYQQQEEEHTTRLYSRFERPRENYPEESYTHHEETSTPVRSEENVEPVTETEFIQNYPENIEQPIKIKNKRKRIRPVLSTTEAIPSTNINIPENELDYTTIPVPEQNEQNEQSEETITIKEVYDFETDRESPTILTTSAATTTTTTTEASTTTKSNRLRRPIKYDVQRPRFSVKDYRQRLNQYMSSSSTTESTKSESTTSSGPKIRYPNRFKIPMPVTDLEDSTEVNPRQKFLPKEPRHKSYNTQSESESTTTEKYVRTVNPRIRPFGRQRSTTEPSTTTTQKISIKPNILNNRNRPHQISLRNRIYNKKRNNTSSTTEINTEEPEINEPSTEKIEVTIPYESAESKIEVTTQIFDSKKDDITTTRKSSYNSKISESTSDFVTPDEAESFLQLQRISDLTSSAHKQYNTPGMFKNMSPTSRRIPSYFTIATEDPILPIEAFFPNLNTKNDKQ